MYLECPCGSEFALARYLMPPWYTYPDLNERLDAWFIEHEHCGSEHGQGSFPTKPKLTYGSDGAPSPKVADYMAKVRAGKIEMGKADDP